MPYVELHCHSTFSFLDGASHPIELAATAAEQGHTALALTDHDGLYGSMELAQADRRRNRHLAQLAERLGVPTVATGNVHAHARERVPLQDAFVAVRLGTTLDESEPARRGNSSHVLAPPESMAERFAEHPEAVH